MSVGECPREAFIDLLHGQLGEIFPSRKMNVFPNSQNRNP